MEIFDFEQAKRLKSIQGTHLEEWMLEPIRLIYSAISEYTGVEYTEVPNILDIKEALGGDLHKLSHIINCGFYGAKIQMPQDTKMFIYQKGFEYFDSVSKIGSYTLTIIDEKR